jgi:hypothetical protein
MMCKCPVPDTGETIKLAAYPRLMLNVLLILYQNLLNLNFKSKRYYLNLPIQKGNYERKICGTYCG